MAGNLYSRRKGEPEYEITDLYWFEENGVHSFDEKDPWIPRFHFRIEGDFEERKVTNDV